MARKQIRFEIDPNEPAGREAMGLTVGTVDRDKNGAEAGFKNFPLTLLCYISESLLPCRLRGPFAVASGADVCIPVKFRNAGASRVVYLPLDIHEQVAFKFASLAYAPDDNDNEWRSTVPEWLIPEKIWYESSTKLLDPRTSQVEFSVLVMERMITLEEYFLSLQEEMPVRYSFESVVLAVCHALKLMAQAAAAGLNTGDWTLANLGFRGGGAGEVRLLDFSDNRLDPGVSAYACVKRAWSSFLQSLICLGSLKAPPRHQKEWSPIFTFLQQYLGRVWWPKGYFAFDRSGVPTVTSVVDLETYLLESGMPTFDEPLIGASAPSAFAVQTTSSEEAPSKDALFEWLRSQGIPPGEGVWISHLCSPNEGFPIPGSMKGKGVKDRMLKWLNTLDGVEVYRDDTPQQEWSFKARPSNSMKAGVEAPLPKEAELAAQLLEPPIPTIVAEEEPLPQVDP
jgi:hypothetical protein